MTTSVDLRDLRVRGDERGWLVPAEVGVDVPFEIRRAYWVFGTESGVRRGFHAHRACRQAAVCVRGGCTIMMDDGSGAYDVRLDSPSKLLGIPPMVWHEMYDFTPDCVLLVFAEFAYDESDYIRDRAEFDRLTEGL